MIALSSSWKDINRYIVQDEASTFSNTLKDMKHLSHFSNPSTLLTQSCDRAASLPLQCLKSISSCSIKDECMESPAFGITVSLLETVSFQIL